MNILVVSNSYPTEKNPTRQVFINNIALQLKCQGHDVDILYNSFFRFFKSDQETGNILTKFGKASLLFTSYLPFILYKCRKYDIIYSHAPLMPGFLMTIASKLHNIKHVIYVHGAVLYIQKNIIAHRLSKYVLSSCDLVFTNSEYMKKKLRTSLKIESEVVTPGYDSERFQNLNRDLRKTDILFAGNCIKRKGVHILLKAIIHNTEYYRENQLSVEICCSGVEKSNVVDLVKRKKLQDIITLKDKLTQEELVSAYNRSKIVVLPSLEEPLGLVGIEAIACGAFLVASKTGGIPEFVKHGENGLLFETGNSTALHSAVQSAFEKKLWSKNDKAQNDLSDELNNYSLCNGIKKTILHFDALLTDAI